MYEINVSTRRVTQYMVQEAYAWLYQRIVAGAYQPNRCKEGKALLIQIQKEQAVTAETYNQFLTCFDPSPFHYMIWRKGKFLTSDSLYDYFVSYNGQPLPIGFVKEFFEDDFETQAELETFLTEVAKHESNDLGLKWRSMLIDLDDKVESLFKFFPGALKPHPALIITRLIYTAVTIGMIAVLLIFLNEIQFFAIMDQFMIQNSFDSSMPLTVNDTISAYFMNGEIFCRAGERFMLESYLTTYSAFFAINVILVIVILARLKKTLQFLFYLCCLIVDNVRIGTNRLFSQFFDKKGIDELQKYFDSLIPEIAKGGKITDEMSKKLPGSKRILTFLQRFDMQKAVDSLQRRHAKYKARGFAFDADKKKEAIRSWRKGLVSSIFWLAVIAVINVPQLYDMVVVPVIEFMSNL